MRKRRLVKYSCKFYAAHKTHVPCMYVSVPEKYTYNKAYAANGTSSPLAYTKYYTLINPDFGYMFIGIILGSSKESERRHRFEAKIQDYKKTPRWPSWWDKLKAYAKKKINT